jgi:membrane-anchored protein YejM (alkaline phosphatase superfamily)
LPDERTVVLSVVVLGGGTFFVVVVEVVVVVGAGFSTTVVHEVRSTAAHARSGVRMISFFIVGIVPSRSIRRRFFG